jgi:hypothetical protein
MPPSIVAGTTPIPEIHISEDNRGTWSSWKHRARQKQGSYLPYLHFDDMKSKERTRVAEAVTDMRMVATILISSF